MRQSPALLRPTLLAAIILASPLLTLAPSSPALAQPEPEADDGGDTILPGYWSYTTKALLVYNKTERRCIKRHEIERVMSGAINHHYTCTYPSRSQSFGHISMKGVCTDKKGQRIPVSMTGVYTPTTLNMQVQVAGVIPVNLQGHRLSATCPAAGEG